ncbi:TIR domain-containing protein [Candidatus Mycobacterium wuenschmannii]|uniref:TIR domain-containing protein n=1 Tax=Candidatus Mycobacterium wuenschmannii TaxID=3027808 RepID=A0ABY8W4G7_9MYCO|nr:TIR domain-containing protein [Candidatus Mycobacterium wuenschmannii]WIM89318.1 TIR domain-containing protein [Candidatus Mycobacterium wuenschmannii]
MHIFVSWSGRPAQVLAAFLQTWLRQVIQELDPFMSTNSIAKGARWSPEIAKRLETTSEAIVCVTSENQDAPWLNFEAGALAKATDSRVRPLLIDLAPSDVTGPLSEFQLTSAADKEDVRRLINSINENCDRSLPTEILDATFEREWPALKEKITEVIKLIGGQPSTKQRKRDDVDLMAEILERVRMMERLGQDQLYTSERIFDELARLRPGVLDGGLKSFESRRRTITATPSRSNKDLRDLYDALRAAWGQSITVIMRNGKIIEGKLTDIQGELPDTTLTVKPDPQSNDVEFVDVISIIKATIHPPAADDEPPF